MKLKELYSKSITRAVNPAVSATKFDPETERIEIQEYVFTDEIMNGLFRILDAIKNNNPYDHVGIWIDGYYGSGKSHFLKYLDYCITPSTQEDALERLLEAVKAIDPMDDKHNLFFDYDQLLSIANWLKKATIDTCIFNLETSYDNTTDKKKAFLHVFWNEFNGKRGFNKFNITLAQNLEKPLAEKGVFEEFKKRIADVGGDWNNPSDAADMVDNELDLVLDIAKELAPSLSIDSIRERIIKRDTNMSIERFGLELAAYLKDKGDDYRLILLADEVSQFINKEKDRYLNLQEIITKLSETCQNKVWVACTAQQDLSEIMDDCNIAEEKDKEGKIKGRFEVKVSLKGTQPEVITQKRILDKKEDVKGELGRLYDKHKAGFDLQFKLPNSYNSYDSKDDFIAYYPFVPYQFKLIMQVFNSFLNLGYVAKEVKGNERSIIKVIHSTAKNNAEAEIGKFVSFDELYNNMFEEGLQARGQKAVDNAIRMARTYDRDSKLAIRVTNVLFMICNIASNDKLIFPANLDNITSLLVNDMTTPRLTIKNEVEKIVEFLCDNNIIRREQGKAGAPDTYAFYSEEEMKVAQLIKNQVVDNDSQAEQLREIFLKYLTLLKNKEKYITRDFAVGISIKQRNYLSNNPDVVVEFAMDMDYADVEQFAIQNTSANRMVFYLGPQFHENKRLHNAFYWYCQANQYISSSEGKSVDDKTREEFEKRAKDSLETLILPEFHKILDTCPIVSGCNVMDETELTGKRGNDRYRAAIQKHMASIYTKAVLVDRPDMPHNTEALKRAILRTINLGDYDGLNAEPTPAEKEVNIYLERQYGEVNVSDVVSKFIKAPYGWDGICTLYIVNELVRRHYREYSFSNNPNVEVSTVASRLVSETNKFTIRQAKAISPQLIKQFTDAWKSIFGTGAALPSSDSTQLYRLAQREHTQSLEKLVNTYESIESEIGQYPFAGPIRDGLILFNNWLKERDVQKFFNLVIENREKARQLFDACKEVRQFKDDQIDNYKMVRSFVRDNRENFQFLPNELKELCESIGKIENLQWPIKIREFIKAKNTLDGALEEVKENLKKEIKNAYTNTYETLRQIAQDQEVAVSVLTSLDSVLLTKTSSNSIAILTNNKNTDKFYEEQLKRILNAKPKPATPPAGKTEPAIIAEPITMSLCTRTTKALGTEDEVNTYLEGLKKQLMDRINEGKSVIII